MNVYWDALWFEIPQLPPGLQWHVFANTAMPSPEDSWTPGSEPVLQDQYGMLVGDRSTVILVGK